MIAKIAKWLMYLLIWMAIEGATKPCLTPLLILVLCVRWLIQNRHNLTTEDDSGEGAA